MKTTLALVIPALALLTSMTYAQTPLREYKAGHLFYVSLPDYMTRTTGLNTAAVFQFKNVVKDVYGFVIEDNKEELRLAELNFSSIDEFYGNFINGFLTDQDQRTVSEPAPLTIGKVNFVQCDVSYFDKEVNTEIYYFVGIAETNDAYYKLLCFCTLDNKEKYREDFQKILFSIRD